MDKEQKNECIIKGCTNCKHEGRFIGDICAPCYNKITIDSKKRIDKIQYWIEESMTERDNSEDNANYLLREALLLCQKEL